MFAFLKNEIIKESERTTVSSGQVYHIIVPKIRTKIPSKEFILELHVSSLFSATMFQGLTYCQKTTTSKRLYGYF